MSTWMNGRIEILQADITTLEVDVVVNAANTSLKGGGGVDGAIHRAAGPKLLEECKTLGGAQPGQVKMTDAYDLPARRVAHAVGPIWRGGEGREEERLASCYSNALRLTVDEDLKTVAFPSISTGAYGFPMEKATRIAQTTVGRFLRENEALDRVVFCCFSEDDRETYETIAREVLA